MDSEIGRPSVVAQDAAYRQPFIFEVAPACAARQERVARCLWLESACFAAWPAQEEERRGNLLLRAAGGYSMRINSGVPLLPADTGVAWSQGHVHDAEAWFAARGLPPQFRLPEPLEGGDVAADDTDGKSRRDATGALRCGAGCGLDPVLAAMGYTATDPTLVQELDLVSWTEGAETAPQGSAVRPVTANTGHTGHAAPIVPTVPAVPAVPSPSRQCAMVAHPAWLTAEGALRARTGTATENPVLRALLATLGGAGQTWLLHAGGQPAVCGLGVRTGDDYGIFAVVARPDLRRQGHGRALVAAMLSAARRDGARSAWLQVGQGNAPARALYEGLGFATSYGYWYRVRY